MKNREVTAMLLAMAFSAATMTACGAYGSLESRDYDPNNSDEESFNEENFDAEYNTEAAVYGAFEDMITEESEEYSDDNLSLNDQYWNWEDGKNQRNGYLELTNRERVFDCLSFSLPDYLQEDDSGAADQADNSDAADQGDNSDAADQGEDNQGQAESLSFTAEESDTDFASMTITRETHEIPGGDGDFMTIIEEIMAEAEAEGHTVDNQNLGLPEADTEVEIITTLETINGEKVITYTAYFPYRISDTEANLITVTFTTTEGCEYSYKDDFMQIIENAKLAER